MPAMGKKLFESEAPSEWSAALAKYQEALDGLASKKQDPSKLKALDRWYLDPKDAASQRKKVTKETLEKLVEWKLTRGTFRPGLLQKAKSNAEKTLVDAYLEASNHLVGAERLDSKMGTSITEAPAELLQAATLAVKALDKNLHGVGPATATGLLARSFPASVAFMSDEAMLGCGLFSKKSDIKYDMKTFTTFNEKVQNRARQLNATLGRREWTGDAVARALWSVEMLAKLAAAPTALPKAATRAETRAKRHTAISESSSQVKKKLKA